MKQNGFYKTSSHGGCGSTVMLWGINGAGYVTDIDKAHIYTSEEIQKEASDGRFSGEMIPLSSRHVDELSTWRVDHQYVKIDDCYPSKVDSNDEYVAYMRREWDGNDLCFWSELGWSFDYGNAKTFSRDDFGKWKNGPSDYILIPKNITDGIARRTFQETNINRRKMIQGAGIIGVRKKRESRDSGKTRWNCPTCGKIHWQFNPYDFDGCDDWACDSYNKNKWDGYDEC